jgi:NitT/TauT family transport system substrate-binding protein
VGGSTTVSVRSRGHGAKALWLALLLVLAVALAACGSDSDSGTSSAASGDGGSQELKEVTFRTGIQPGPWDAPWFVAKEKGFYEDAGLDVDIKGGLGSASNVQLAASSKADFVHADGSNVALAVQKGAPIKMVGSFVQNAGSGIAASPDIKTPQDMAGKTFGGPVYDYTSRLIPAFEKASGAKDIKVQTVDPAALPQVLLQGRVDMMPALGWAEVPELKADNHEFNYFPFSDYGLTLIGPGIVTNEKHLKDDPDMVKAFVEASAKGWQYSFDHPDEAAEILKKNAPTQRLDYAQAITPVQSEFAHTPATENDKLGWMSPEDWGRTVDVLVENGVLPEKIDAASAYENVLPQK